jgi:hypothetical protein
MSPMRSGGSRRSLSFVLGDRVERTSQRTSRSPLQQRSGTTRHRNATSGAGAHQSSRAARRSDRARHRRHHQNPRLRQSRPDPPWRSASVQPNPSTASLSKQIGRFRETVGSRRRQGVQPKRSTTSSHDATCSPAARYPVSGSNGGSTSQAYRPLHQFCCTATGYRRSRRGLPTVQHTLNTVAAIVAAMTLEVWCLTWRQTPRTVADWTALPGLRSGRNPCFTDWTALGGLVVRDSQSAGSGFDSQGAHNKGPGQRVFRA